jgi:hypothetical protein
MTTNIQAPAPTPIITQLFKPKEAIPPAKFSTYRVGLQGPPKSGKTWSALSFPNPIVLNLDNNLPVAHPKVRSGEVTQVPFYDDNFYKTYENGKFLPERGKNVVARHYAILKWLRANGPQIKPEQTLILDSMTFLANYVDIFEKDNPSHTKQGKVDEFAPWRHKVEYFTELHEIIKALNCNFVTTIHEQPEYDEDARIIGLKPCMTGSFASQLAGHYTEWFRQVNEYKQGKDGETIPYGWMVKSKKIDKCGGNLVSLLPKGVDVIPARYSEIQKLLEGIGGK